MLIMWPELNFKTLNCSQNHRMANKLGKLLTFLIHEIVFKLGM